MIGKKKLRVYANGVWDLFHYNHVRLFKKIKEMFPDCHLIIGVHTSECVCAYKREPILTYEERSEVVQSCVYVDEIVMDDVIEKSADFYNYHKIDIICYAKGADFQKELENEFINFPQENIVYLPYGDGITTTKIIKRITDRYSNSD